MENNILIIYDIIFFDSIKVKGGKEDVFLRR